MNEHIKVMLFVLIGMSAGVTKMALGDVGKVCLFSAISGVITLDGKPVVHAKLIRTVRKEKPHTDETTTDEQGRFALPAVFERTVTKYLPMEFVVNQTIKVEYQGKEYLMWEGVKRKEEENAESRGMKLIVDCELSKERYLKQVDGSPIISVCNWDAKADEPYNF